MVLLSGCIKEVMSLKRDGEKYNFLYRCMIIFINGVLISPVTVCLCASGIESRDHIFCYFAINKAMWGTYFCRVSVPTRSRIDWICHFSACDRLRCKVWRVAWYAVICHVLRECNMYVNGVTLHPPHVFC